jgi:6-phosphogluconolactonase
MPAPPEVLKHRTPTELAEAVAARLITRLVDIQSAGRVPSIVLTGGSVADRVHRAVADSPAAGAVEWSRVDVWWGDERFVPASSKERNAGQAAAALLDRLPFDPARVHPMPASDGPEGDDVDAAAEAYAAQLRDAARPEDHGETPRFDVLMLGVGPDGHCASLFPGHPAVQDERPVVAVRNSPKPPPTRITLTLGPLGRAREVWFVASGESKATAVRNALSDAAGPLQVPAAGPRGSARTLWLLDAEAAGKLAPGLNRIASP